MRPFLSTIDYFGLFPKSTVFNNFLQALSVRVMDDSKMILDQLQDRLNKAEADIKLLNVEVKSIRTEIINTRARMLAGGTSKKSRSNWSIKSTVREAILIPSLANPDRDVPATKRIKIENSDGCDDTDQSNGQFTKEDGFVVAYTDGACENNGRPNAKAGIGVWFGDNHPLNISKPVNGRATNNTAEIQACVECLKVLKQHGISNAKLYTDSQFTINCMKSWIHNWKKNNWKTASGQPVKNKEDLVILDTTMNEFSKVEFVHVAGHRGIRGNEEADRLARNGALQYKK